jgi:hypothetical protein
MNVPGANQQLRFYHKFVCNKIRRFYASCNCGAPVVPAFKRAEDAIKANPEKSNRQIAEETGVGKDTVRRARNSGGAHAPTDERPTIDNPPKGSLWDDQDDRDEEDQTRKGELSVICAC